MVITNRVSSYIRIPSYHAYSLKCIGKQYRPVSRHIMTAKTCNFRRVVYYLAGVWFLIVQEDPNKSSTNATVVQELFSYNYTFICHLIMLVEFVAY